MLVYGNDITNIDCIVKNIDNNYTLIDFLNHRQLFVPNIVIKSKIEKNNTITTIGIDTWFLKKNRIIPLF